MKIGTKLMLSFILIAILIGGTGWTLFSSISASASQAQMALDVKQHEIVEITELMSKIQDFSIENFHEQLEVWEYAYEPNEKRLNAFYGHLITWERLFAEFLELAEHDEHSEGQVELSEEDEKIVEDLKTGIVLVRKSWHDYVLETERLSTGVIESATLKEDGTEKYPLLDDMAEYNYAYSYPMFDMATVDASHPSLFQKVVDMETLFDEANFNKNADRFVLSQQAKLAAKQEEIDQLFAALDAEFKAKNSQFLVIFAIVLALAVALALFLANVISKPLIQLKDAADKTTSGDFNVVLPEAKGDDEVAQLTGSVEMLVTAFKAGRKKGGKK